MNLFDQSPFATAFSASDVQHFQVVFRSIKEFGEFPRHSRAGRNPVPHAGFPPAPE
jgi:hypothetical protein